MKDLTVGNIVFQNRPIDAHVKYFYELENQKNAAWVAVDKKDIEIEKLRKEIAKLKEKLRRKS